MRNKLIAYVMDFVSFLIENRIFPKKVILYGSVASGDFDRESDIDVFIDIKESEEDRIRGLLDLFEKNFGEKWELKGVENPLSIIVGNLDDKKWTNLRRSIVSNGIILYNVESTPPTNLKSYIIFKLDFSSLERSEKVNLWRKLYGYSQKIGKKEYGKKGLVERLNGQKIERGIVIIPSENEKKFSQFLNENKINFEVNEIWSTEELKND